MVSGTDASRLRLNTGARLYDGALLVLVRDDIAESRSAPPRRESPFRPYCSTAVPVGLSSIPKTLYTILCKCLFSEVTVQAVTELDNKAAHCHTPVPQRHRPFL